jgi:uncharacterized protein (TIGR02452 family)
MTKEDRIEIFNETIEHSRKMRFESETEFYSFDDFEVVSSDNDTNIYVLGTDTVSAAQKMSVIGRTALLNMASYKRPGGGVRRGAQAQEECLFRCSNLGDAIPSTNYPLDIDEGLYTRDAYFFRDFYYGFIDTFQVDVMTVPAFNLGEQEVDMNFYEQTTKDKIILMLGMAMENKAENLVLGAWGCGVFKNDPKTMARLFNEVLTEKFDGVFKNVVFAIINDKNSVDDNFNIFKNVIEIAS